MWRVRLLLILLTTSCTALSAELSLTFEQDRETKNLELVLKNASSEKKPFFDVFSHAGFPPVTCQFARLDGNGRVVTKSDEFTLNELDSWGFPHPAPLSFLYPNEKKGIILARSAISARMRAAIAKLPDIQAFNVVRFTSWVGLDELLAKKANAESPYYSLRDYLRDK